MSGPIQNNKETEKPMGGGNGGDSEKSKSQINADYFQELEKWLSDMRMYRSSCDLFFSNLCSSMYYNQYAKYQNQPPPQTRTNNNIPPPVPPLHNVFSLINMFYLGGQDPNEDQPQQQQAAGGSEFVIPPLWKRFVAEVFDFFLLFLMKLAITYIAVDFFDFVNINRYETMIPDEMDYSLIVELTSEILILELLHRLMVCAYEGLFLHKAMQHGVGGATPGKTVMGLRVIFCTNIQPSDRPNVVKVTPATDIGLPWSFARACLKNLVLALLIPICFPFFFNKFNRSSYDIICHTLVVEERRPRNRHRRRR